MQELSRPQEELRRLGLTTGTVEVTPMTTRARVFDQKNSDAVLAIELADSEAERHVKIWDFDNVPWPWPRNTASILPKGWKLKSTEQDYFYLFLLRFHETR